jgi:hypothetical protein
MANRQCSAVAVCRTCQKSFAFYGPPCVFKRGGRRYCSDACYRNRPLVPLIDRFFRYVGRKTGTGCIPWVGPMTAGRGYLGKGRAGQGSVFAHRVAYEFAFGPIPDGLVVCHRCDNPACVNPSHMFLGTQSDNMADMNAKGRHARGEGSGGKLSASDIPAIRAALAAGEAQESVGRRFGITQSAVSRIKLGKNWRHV